MSRPILPGPDYHAPQKPPARSGGVEQAKDLNYQPPVGPKHINREGPGLRGGINHGNSGSQGC